VWIEVSAARSHGSLAEVPDAPADKGGRHMAIYHLNVRGVCPRDGSSAVRSSAYQSGTRLRVSRTGELADYSRKERVSASGLALPDGAPAWASERNALWDAAEAAWGGGNELVARRVIVALPVELDRDLALASVADLARAWTAQGRAVDWAVHGLGGDNPHAHLLVSAKALGPDGFATEAKKAQRKSYLCRRGGDESWVSAAEWKAAKKGGWEKVYRWRVGDGEVRLTRTEAIDGRGLTMADRVGKSPVSKAVNADGSSPMLDAKADLKALRKRWESIANERLAQQAERDGSTPVHVDCRSFADRGIDRVASIHEGPSVTAIESREGGSAPVTRVHAENLRKEAINLASDAAKIVSFKVTDAAEWSREAEDAQRDADAERARARQAKEKADQATQEAKEARAEADKAKSAKEASEAQKKALDASVKQAQRTLEDARKAKEKALDEAREAKAKADADVAAKEYEAQSWAKTAAARKAEADAHLDEAREAKAKADADVAAKEYEAQSWAKTAAARKAEADAHLDELGVTRDGLATALAALAREVAEHVVDMWDAARGWARDHWDEWLHGWGLDVARDLGVSEAEHEDVSRREMRGACRDLKRPDVMEALYGGDAPSYGDEGAR
jgi:flagellar biosynthesis GTPase FlhF